MFIVKRLLWSLRRTLGLSPMQQVFAELRRRGVQPGKLVAVELFAHSGFLHTRDYQSQVASLEAWEIDPGQERALRRNLPRAEVRITDSYEEVQKTPRKFNLILIDAPDGVHGAEGQYCEHFQMFPRVFRVAQDSTVLILNVMPGQENGTPQRLVFTEAHLEHRRQFYGTNRPAKTPVPDIIPIYRELIEAHGFELEWHYSCPRTRDRRLHYLVLKVKRRPPRQNGR